MDAGFNTPVSLADLSILGQRRGRVGRPETAAYHPADGSGCFSSQGQGVIAALLNHLLRYLTLAVPGISGNYLAPQSRHFQQIAGAAP